MSEFDWDEGYKYGKSPVESIKELEAKLKTAVEALEYYAEPLYWRTKSGKVGVTFLTNGNDSEMIDGHFTGGKRARQALKQIKGE